MGSQALLRHGLTLTRKRNNLSALPRPCTIITARRKVHRYSSSPSPLGSRQQETRLRLLSSWRLSSHFGIVGKRQESWLQSRSFLSIPGFLLPPVVFVGLALTLWAYKCLMMVVFQNKIIYMPSVPPFSRSEKISDYAGACGPVAWKEEGIKSLDGTRISLCIGRNFEENTRAKEGLVIVYFQGYDLTSTTLLSSRLTELPRNAASLPPRLPGLSSVLRKLAAAPQPVYGTIVAVSYRGFWTSSGRPSQPGMELDAASAIKYAQALTKEFGVSAKMVFWGQSVGGGVACTAAANYLEGKHARATGQNHAQVDGIILETPFVSIRKMLAALYPQKWLPYRYLWPFLRNWWDSEAALQRVQQHVPKLSMLCLTAERDEIVPKQQADELLSLCRRLKYDLTHFEVRGALHTEAMARNQGQMEVVKYLQALMKEPDERS